MWGKKKNLILGISHKKDGSMKLGVNGNIINRKKFWARQNIEYSRLVATSLMHGNKVTAVGKKETGKILNNGTDGLVTNIPGIFLSVTVADCLPLYFYDPCRKVIGIAHAGWRGVLKNIATKMVRTMKQKYHSDPRKIMVYIGPHIKKCHFEVNDDVARRFLPYLKNKGDYCNGDKMKLDLAEIVRSQLSSCGVLTKRVIISKECTFCQKDKYFSYRRDKPKEVAAMVAYIGMIS